MRENSKHRNLTAVYSFTLFAYWMGFAAISAFASMYLLHFQVSNTMIGTVIALANVITAVLQPVLGTFSDRYEKFSARRLVSFFMLLVIVIAAELLIFKNRSVVVICLLYGICILGMSMAQPFVNSIGVLCINAGYSLDFGIARAAGSVGYAFSAYVLGQLADRFGVKVIPAVFLLSFGLVLVSLCLLPQLPGMNAGDKRGEEPDLPPDGSKPRDKMPKGNFFRRYPAFTLVLIGLIGIYFGHIILNSYTLQIVETKGGGSAEMGTATSLAAVVELIMMLIFTRLMKKIQLRTLLCVSVVGFTLKVLFSLLVTDMTGFYFVQLIQMFGWGIMAVGLIYYVNEVMAPEDCVKGQAYATMTYTIGCVAGSWIGGAMIDRLGVPVMLLCGTILSAIGAAIFCLGMVKQQFLEKPEPASDSADRE